MVDIVVKGDYDYYIYDLVPLGHALYYLSMAKVYDEWINRITKLREEMREHEEMVARIKRETATEEDQILSELQYIKNRINQSSGILTDKEKTAFFFVVVPEEMIILDTQKAAQLFAKFDVPIAGYVVNRVLPKELLDAAGACLPAEPAQDAGQLPAEDRHHLRQGGGGLRSRAGTRRHWTEDDRKAGRPDVRRKRPRAKDGVHRARKAVRAQCEIVDFQRIHCGASEPEIHLLRRQGRSG